VPHSYVFEAVVSLWTVMTGGVVSLIVVCASAVSQLLPLPAPNCWALSHTDQARYQVPVCCVLMSWSLLAARTVGLEPFLSADLMRASTFLS